MSTGTCPHRSNKDLSKVIQTCKEAYLSPEWFITFFVDCIPQLSCVCLSTYSNNRSSKHPHPPSTDSRASSVSADRGRMETVQTVELFPLEDLIYYGRGKSERMTDINIKDSVVLKTASAWQRQKSRLLITRGALDSSKGPLLPLYLRFYALFTLSNIGNVHAGHIDVSQIVL